MTLDGPAFAEFGVTRVMVNAPHVETVVVAERLADRLEHVRGLLPVTVPTWVTWAPYRGAIETLGEYTVRGA